MGMNSADPIIFESVSQVTATLSSDLPLGTRLIKDGKQYLYVYNAGNSEISVGEGVTVSAVSGYSVTVSSVTMVDSFLGVCHHSTIPTGYYGWVVTRGFAKVKAPTNGPALTAGALLTPGADGRWAVNNIVTNATAPLVQAKCTVATASAGVGEGFVNLLG